MELKPGTRWKFPAAGSIWAGSTSSRLRPIKRWPASTAASSRAQFRRAIVSLPELSSDEPRGVLVRRQRSSIYTVLLLIALLAVLFGCLMMIMEWWQYSFQYKPPANLRSELPRPTINLQV